MPIAAGRNDTIVETFLFKKIEAWILVLVLVLVLLAGWLFSAVAVSATRGSDTYGSLGKAARTLAELPNQAGRILFSTSQDKTRSALPDAIALNQFDPASTTPNPNNHLFTQYTKSNGQIEGLVLKEFATGQIRARWKTDSEVVAISDFDDTLITMGARGDQDSTETLAKTNRDGKQLWRLAIASHHSVHVDSDGFIYTPIRNDAYDGVAARLLQSRRPYRDDGYAVISPDGQVVDSGSATEILLKNGLGHYLFGVGALEWDAIHLNSVKPAPRNTEHYQTGDLLISMRHLSMVLLVRPGNQEIVWYQIGPWTNQHDADFLPDGRISVFGNDVASSHVNRVKTKAPLISGHNQIYVYDFASDQTSTPYADFMAKVGLATVTGGTHLITGNGDLQVYFYNRGILSLFEKATGKVRHVNLMRDGQSDLINGMTLLLQ